MKKKNSILRDLSVVFINLLVFAVAGSITVLLTKLMVSTYPDVKTIYLFLWVTGIIVMWVNTLRINWVSWLFEK